MSATKAEKRATRFAKVTLLQNFWRELFPALQEPSYSQFVLWLNLHRGDEGIVLHGLREAATKNESLGGRMDLDYVVKFASRSMNIFDGLLKKYSGDRPRLREECYVSQAAPTAQGQQAPPTAA